MFLSNFSVKKPISMVVIIIGLMALGLLALSKLRVNQIPDVEQPLLVVGITYPGASPETAEREIINRIEKSLNSISGVTEVRATASEGYAQLLLIFNFNKNMIEAADEVRNAIAAVRHKLPIEMREPVLQRIDPSAQPIMQLALSSSAQTHAEISRLAEDQLADRFRSIPGVATVTVNGALNRELSVLLSAQKLREFNVSVSEVVNALRMQNTTAPVGKVRGLMEDQSIRLLGRIESPSDFNQIVVKRSGNELIRLGQVATVQDGFAEQTGFSVRNGHPNVGLSVTRARDASTVTVADATRKLVEEINATLPKGTQLEVTQDGGRDAQDSLNNVIHALVFGAGLTVFVVYVFLNSWRSTMITALSLPTSVIAAFIAVWLCGFTLNFMSLLGLSLAIGVLIDDAIVVRENIVRHMERGADRRTAALKGTAEIGLAVAATTFSIVAVFIPVAFMPGVSGEWFRPFGLTVVASVLVSLFISFTLDPMLSAYWGDPPGHHEAPKRGFSKLLQRFNHWFDHQADRYGLVIAWALHHRKWMAFFAILSFVVALFLQSTFGGTSFLPASDSGTIAIEVRTPASSSLEYARLKMAAGSALARQMPETKATNEYVNVSGGRIYVDIGKSTERKRGAPEIAADLRKRVARLVGAEYVVLDDLNNGAQKPVQIRFHGADSRKLMEITTEFMAKLRNVPGAVDVGLSEQDPQDELQIELNRGLANSLGISVGDAANALRVAFAGVEVGDWVDPSGETRDVAVRLAPSDRVDASNIERLPIAVTGAGVMVPLEQIATVSMGKGPAKIQHSDGKRMIAVSANAHGRAPGGAENEPAGGRQAFVGGLAQGARRGARRGYQGRIEARSSDQLPAGLRHRTGGGVEGSGRGVRRDVRGADLRHRPDVPDPGDAVRQLHSAAGRDAVLAAVADRGGGGPVADQGHAEPDELHRDHHAGRSGGQERDPVAGRGASGGGGRRPARGSADACGPQAIPSHPDDDLRADRGHAAGGGGRGGGRGVLPSDGRGDHWRHDHLDLPDLADGAELLRQHRDQARQLHGQVPAP